MTKNFLLTSFFLSLMCSYSFAQLRIPQDTLITLERNPGYWGQVGVTPCPFYKLTIYANGTVELMPKEYACGKILTGKIIKSQVSRKKLKQLISEFDKSDFYSLESTSENGKNIENGEYSKGECPQYGTDDVTAIMSITVNGKTKQIEHYHGCRGAEYLSKLTDLENKIDEIVNIKQWFDCYKGKNRINLSSQFN